MFRLTLSSVLACLLLGSANLRCASAQSYRDLAYGQSDNRPLLLDLDIPATPGLHPLLIELAPLKPKADATSAALLQHGFAVARAAYLPTGYFGTYRRFPLDLYSCKAAIRYLRANAAQYKIDPDKIAVAGQDGGATMALLAAATNNMKNFEGDVGSYPTTPSNVSAVCEAGGLTDLTHAELYGHEFVNEPAGVAYALLGGNVKEHREESWIVSPAYYITPNTPPCLVLPAATDINPAMRDAWLDQLHRAGVTAQAATGDDPAALATQTVSFLTTVLAQPPAHASEPQQAQVLITNRLFLQAHRLVDPYIRQNPDDPTWLPLSKALSNAQAVAAADDLKYAIAHNEYEHAQAALWDLRHAGTSRDLVAGWQSAMNAMQASFDHRYAVRSQATTVNHLVLAQDWNAADRTMRAMLEMASLSGQDDQEGLVQDTATRLHHARANANLQTMGANENVRIFPWASAYGADLYGTWVDLRIKESVIRLRYIPPGKSTIGSPLSEWGRLPDETAAHTEEISHGFWIAETPCTQEFYEAVMGSAANHSYFRGAKLPVEDVSYAHASNFCKTLGLNSRLPTETEWEYACRAGTTTPYAGTGRLADCGWYWDNGQNPDWPAHVVGPEGRTTHQVALKLANPFGLYDMQGNVWQWCQGERKIDSKEFHVARGGSWISIAQSCRAARTQWQNVEYATWNSGFRFVIPAEDGRAR
jgi:formylglycine-generating enzyme